MEFAERYEATAAWIVERCPAPDKFAHTYAGLAIWLAAAFALRRPLRSPGPLAVVALAELVNETIDRLARDDWAMHDTLRDAAATLFWPAVLTIALANSRTLRRGRAALPPPRYMSENWTDRSRVTDRPAAMSYESSRSGLGRTGGPVKLFCSLGLHRWVRKTTARAGTTVSRCKRCNAYKVTHRRAKKA